MRSKVILTSLRVLLFIVLLMPFHWLSIFCISVCSSVCISTLSRFYIKRQVYTSNNKDSRGRSDYRWHAQGRYFDLWSHLFWKLPWRLTLTLWFLCSVDHYLSFEYKLYASKLNSLLITMFFKISKNDPLWTHFLQKVTGFSNSTQDFLFI